MTEQFFPHEELSRVQKGSYEELLPALTHEVQQAASRLFGESAPVRLVATFPSYAVVMHPVTGKAVRVKYELAADGLPKIVSHTDYPLKSFQAEGYVQEKIKSVVSAILEGNDATAYKALKSILPLVEERKEILSSPDLYDVVVQRLTMPVPWKQALKENQQKILNALGDELAMLDQSRLDPKFSKLYNGEVPLESLGGYEDLVKSDLRTMVARFESLSHEAKKLSERVTELATSMKDDELAYAGFVMDFEADSKEVTRVLKEAEMSISDLGTKARLYDVAAKALYQYDVASRYIHTVALKGINRG